LRKQLEPFINSRLSPYLCGFRKSYSPQHSLLNMMKMTIVSKFLRWCRSYSDGSI